MSYELFDLEISPYKPVNEYCFNEEATLFFNGETSHLVRDRLNESLDTVFQSLSERNTPFSGKHHNELWELIKNIDLSKPQQCFQSTLDELKTLYLNDTFLFHDQQYLAHLNCPVFITAIAAELISTCLNTAVETWDQSAGATHIEQMLINRFTKHIGFETEADGVFTSGGTQSNLMGLLFARDSICFKINQWNVKHNGLPNYAHRLRILTSEHSHYSIQKSAALLGLGKNSVVSIKTDSQFKISTKELNQTIKTLEHQGLIPFAVIATAGTTDFGSIDPISTISQICNKHDLWLHVDAAYGGALLLSKKYKHWLAGIEHANSVGIDFHKTFFQPVACSAFFLKDRSNFKFISHHASYLNPLLDEIEGIPNLANKSLQTTRRFDALKLWLSLRHLGEDVIGTALEKLIHLIRRAYLLFSSESRIDVITPPQLTTLVFRYLPYDASLTPEELNNINRDIRQMLYESGKTLVASTIIDCRQYLKITLLNPQTTLQDLQDALITIVKTGNSIHQSHISNRSRL